jgi:hypothetical protein
MNLMEDVLDLSSIESDHILQKEALRTEEVTTRILKQLKPRFTAKNQRAGSVIEEAMKGRRGLKAGRGRGLRLSAAFRDEVFRAAGSVSGSRC